MLSFALEFISFLPEHSFLCKWVKDSTVFSEIVLSVLGHWLFIPCGFSNATLSLFLYLYSLPLRFYHCDVNVSVVILGIFQPEKVKTSVKTCKKQICLVKSENIEQICVVYHTVSVYAMLKIGL